MSRPGLQRGTFSRLCCPVILININMSRLQITIILVYGSCIAPFSSGYNETNPFTTRLIGGQHDYEGRVEIFHEGSWATVCEQFMSIEAAHVLCRMAGHASATSYHCCAEFGRGQGDSVFSNLICDGHELNITDCAYEFGKHESIYSSSLDNCDHSEDVGVTCNPAQVRLKGGSSSLTMRDGQVEIFYNNMWLSICSDAMDINLATVLCRMSDYHTARRYYDLESGSIEDGNVVNDVFLCQGDEDHYNDCVSLRNGHSNCSSNRLSAIVCMSLSVRLVSSKANEGRVEITNDNNKWSPVCFNGWSIQAANVTCRMLGYFGALQIFREQRGLLDRTSTISVDDTALDIICEGTENNLAHCNISDIRQTSCENTEYAAARCLGEREVPMRLSGGADSSEGRLEIFYYGSWGTVCVSTRQQFPTPTFYITIAEVICRTLGFPGAIDYKCCSHFGPGVGGVFFYAPYCGGKESSILDCNRAINGLFPRCNHFRDLGVVCQKNYDLDIRLVGGSTPNEGRVEVLYEGTWGTICDDNWDLNDANVVCRMLGYERAENYSCCAFYGEGAGDIIFDDVECQGSEVNLGHCPRNELRSHDCSHSEDVGVKCIDMRSEITHTTGTASVSVTIATEHAEGSDESTWKFSGSKTIGIVVTQTVVIIFAIIVIVFLYMKIRMLRNNLNKLDFSEFPLTGQDRGNTPKHDDGHTG